MTKHCNTKILLYSGLLSFVIVFCYNCSTNDRSDFRKAIELNTANDIRLFTKKWPNSKYTPQANALLLEFENNAFLSAKKKGSIQSFLRYLNEWPEGRFIEQAKIYFDDIYFVKATGKQEIVFFRDYLNIFPTGKHASEVNSMIDELMWAICQKEQSHDSFLRYLNSYPNGKYAKEAEFKCAQSSESVEELKKYIEMYRHVDSKKVNEIKKVLDEVIAYEKASTKDWYSAYQNYIKAFPNGKHVIKAKERLEWLRSNKAVVQLDYPKNIEQKESPYYNVDSPFWDLDIVFKELGGKIGYKLREGTRYYYGGHGGTWYSEGEDTIEVNPGASKNYNTWWFDKNHQLCNGTHEVVWFGVDAGGHPISIKVVVKSSHISCPALRPSKSKIPKPKNQVPDSFQNIENRVLNLM